MPGDIDAKIEADLVRLRSMPIVELRARWRAKFKHEPPEAFGPDLLRFREGYAKRLLKITALFGRQRRDGDRIR